MQLSIIVSVIIMAALLIPFQPAHGISMTSYQAKLDRTSYQNTDSLHIFLFGKPYDVIYLRVLDHSSLKKFSDVIHLRSDGLALYSVNLTSYVPEIYSVMLDNGDNLTKLDFAVGIAPSGGYRIELNTTKTEFNVGDSIPLSGILDANSTIKVVLTDPQNVLQYSITTQSNAKGMFSTILHVPIHSIAGIWQIDAMDDNHSRQSIILVHPSNQTNGNYVYCCESTVTTKLLDSPLKQFKSGIKPEDVKCKQDFILVIKSEDNSCPACAKPLIALKLLEQGWGKIASQFETKIDLLDSKITGGQITGFHYDLQVKSIVIKIQASGNGNLAVTIPRELIDARLNGHDDNFYVLSNGMESNYTETSTTNTSRTLLIPFTPDTLEIEIIATFVGQHVP